MNGFKIFNELILIRPTGYYCLITKDAVWRYMSYDQRLSRMNGRGIEHYDEVTSVEEANEIIQKSSCSFYEVPLDSLEYALLGNLDILSTYDHAAYRYSMMASANDEISAFVMYYVMKHLVEAYKRDIETEISNVILRKIGLPGVKL